MSFGEIGKSVNSKLRTPLNHLIWLNDYKTYGESSYVFKDKNILDELYRSPISINDEMLYGEVVDYLLGLNDVSFISNIYGISDEDKVLFADKTIDDICNDVDLLNVIAKYESLMDIFENSELFKAKIQSSGLVQTVSQLGGIEKSNVFCIQAFSGYYMTYVDITDKYIYTYGSCEVIYHGEEAATVLRAAASQVSTAGITNTILKFCKNIKNNTGTVANTTNMWVKYIQLDSVS